MGASKLNIDTTGTPSIIVSADSLTDSTALRIGTSGDGPLLDMISHGLPTMAIRVYRQTSTALSGVSQTLTGLIPANSILLALRTRVLTAVTGAASSQVGVTGDLDRFAVALANTLGSQSNIAQFDVAGVSPLYYKTATDVLLTANTTNYTAGVICVEAIVIQVSGLEIP